MGRCSGWWLPLARLLHLWEVLLRQISGRTHTHRLPQVNPLHTFQIESWCLCAAATLRDITVNPLILCISMCSPLCRICNRIPNVRMPPQTCRHSHLLLIVIGFNCILIWWSVYRLLLLSFLNQTIITINVLLISTSARHYFFIREKHIMIMGPYEGFLRRLRLFWPRKMVPSVASSSKTPSKAPLYVFHK